MSGLSNLEFSLFENMIAIAFGFFMLGIMVWAIVNSLRKRFNGKRVVCEATVVAKTTEQYASQPVFMQDKQVNTGVVEKGLLYIVFFRDVEGRELSFEVSKNFFEQIVEGQKDKLIYKNSKLVQFGNLQNVCVSEGASFKGLSENL